jgi:hypothetical protein
VPSNYLLNCPLAQSQPSAAWKRPDRVSAESWIADGCAWRSEGRWSANATSCERKCGPRSRLMTCNLRSMPKSKRQARHKEHHAYGSPFESARLRFPRPSQRRDQWWSQFETYLIFAEACNGLGKIWRERDLRWSIV